MKKKTGSKVIAAVLALAMALTEFVIVPKNVKAEETSVVKYQQVAKADFEAKIDAKEVPECTLTDEASGYLFGGWYKDGEGKSPIKTKEAAGEAKNVYAKFVPARLTGVSCQIGVDAASADKTKLRAVSTVDSTNYKAVGFNVYGRLTDESGKVTDWDMYTYDASKVNLAQGTKVYSDLQTYKLENNEIVEDGVKKPEDVFGEDAKGFKFTTVGLTNIARDYYDMIVVIKPYWLTLDGTYVEGIGEFDRVQDGIDGIVNISVNLREAKAIAAGMMSITYPEGYEYQNSECGRVFEEMEFYHDAAGKKVSCVGNVKDITKNTDRAEDIYVNLRFRKQADIQAGTSEFAVSVVENGFCDKSEQVAKVTAWSVRY